MLTRRSVLVGLVALAVPSVLRGPPKKRLLTSPTLVTSTTLRTQG
jgi:hypothetical protein